MRNIGSQTWRLDEGFELVFVRGESFGSKKSYTLRDVVKDIAEVPPGKTLDISIQLRAPEKPGEHEGMWVLFAPDRQRLTTLSVEIKVEATVPASEPTTAPGEQTPSPAAQPSPPPASTTATPTP